MIGCRCEAELPFHPADGFFLDAGRAEAGGVFFCAWLEEDGVDAAFLVEEDDVEKREGIAGLLVAEGDGGGVWLIDPGADEFEIVPL